MPSLVAQGLPLGNLLNVWNKQEGAELLQRTIPCGGLYTQVTCMEISHAKGSMSHGLKEKGQTAAPSAHQAVPLSPAQTLGGWPRAWGRITDDFRFPFNKVEMIF